VKGKCVCGCGRPVAARHHVVYEQELRKVVGALRHTGLARVDRDRLLRLTTDPRNLVFVAFDCHGAHHSGARRYPLSVLPDSVFEFAAEVLGPRAHRYLRARYAGDDARLDLLRLIEAA
jgi:hypothetical protein